MGPDDSVNMVMELSQNDNQNKCEDHYDYLVRRKKLDGVKRDDRVVEAQTTTNNRSKITLLKQWRWY